MRHCSLQRRKTATCQAFKAPKTTRFRRTITSHNIC